MRAMVPVLFEESQVVLMVVRQCASDFVASQH